MARCAPSDLEVVSGAVQHLISFQSHSPLSSSHTVQAMDSARSSYEDDAAALKNATGPCVPTHPFCCGCSVVTHLFASGTKPHAMASSPHPRQSPGPCTSKGSKFGSCFVCGLGFVTVLHIILCTSKLFIINFCMYCFRISVYKCAWRWRETIKGTRAKKHPSTPAPRAPRFARRPVHTPAFQSWTC